MRRNVFLSATKVEENISGTPPELKEAADVASADLISKVV